MLRTPIGLVFALFVLGCGPSDRPLPRVDRGPSPDPGRDPLGAAMHADLVDHGGQMETYETPVRGRLQDDGSAERSIILPAGYCYAVFARVDGSAGELSMRLVDSNGDPRQLDRETGAAARIGMNEPLCPEPTTEFRVELRAEHPGAFVVQVLRASMI